MYFIDGDQYNKYLQYYYYHHHLPHEVFHFGWKAVNSHFLMHLHSQTPCYLKKIVNYIISI